MPSLSLTAVSLLLAAVHASRSSRHRLEPADGTVVHCGGSGGDDFQPYFAYLPPQARPSGFMTYLGLDSLNSTAPGTVNAWFTELNTTLAAFGDPSAVFLIPQIGLAIPDHGKEIIVANGSLDTAIHSLVNGLEALARPVYVRIGYEFDGSWHSFKPDTYVAAWKRIVGIARANSVVNRTAAFVWDRTCDADFSSDVHEYYPGDDMVDWWGVNIYSDHSAPGDTECVAAFVKKASDAGFPVMLGEVTPRGKNTSDTSTWKDWFEPFFDLLDGHGAIKHVSYINRAWNFNPSYKGWGDSRIQTAGANASGVAAAYVARMANTSRFLNAMGEDAILSALGLGPSE